MPKRNIKSVDVRPDIDGAGHITGYAATFTREPDWAGDVIAKGAFAECLERIKANGVERGSEKRPSFNTSIRLQ